MVRILYSAAVAVIAVAALFFYAPFSGKSKAQTSQTNLNVAENEVSGNPGKKMSIAKNVLTRLNAKSPGALVSVSEATGAANFIRVKDSSANDLLPVSTSLKSKSKSLANVDKSKAFFSEYAGLFGIANPETDLREQKNDSDQLGGNHKTFQQFYQGVPVYAGIIKTHLNKNDSLYSVGGNIVPDIDVDINPNHTSDDAASVAVGKVAQENGVNNLHTESAKLLVFRTGLIQGIPGEDHLVWEVTVTDNAMVREYVYIDAHTNKFVDQYTGVSDALSRRAFDYGGGTTTAPTTYTTTATPFWIEGQAFPTSSAEANNMITSSGETYALYNKAFGRDSYDNAGHIMDSLFNRGYSCPNASWNGNNFISFCPGLTTDDVTAHEWSHAYTQFTHGLIYAWQPGALNEGYSDVFGETVDRINGRDGIGNSLTDPARNANACSTNSPAVTRLTINSPAAIAGVNPAQFAAFGPTLDSTGPVTGNVVVALDAADGAGPATNDGCSTITNAAAVNGNIALVYRGTCNFSVKVYNAQLAGATAVIVGNNVATGLPGMGAGINAGLVTIPSVGVTQGVANNIVTQLANGAVNVTLAATPNTDASTRWLLGEDDTGALAGALRDMYNPTCYSNPGKVTDTAYYSCGPNTSVGDNGGVHTNSGIVNHAYALLVDGGTYNGQTINAIGLTKAAHIYFRAESIYQNPASDFSFHADSLEQSATDLMGVNLNDLITGLPSGQIITPADVQQVRNVIQAVEFRIQPTACAFAPLLAQAPPAEPTCTGNTARAFIFQDDFEGANQGWTFGRSNTLPGNSLADWTLVGTLPDNRAGKGYFVSNPYNSCNAGTQDQTALRYLQSPSILIPASYNTTMTLAFDHWIASESTYDGGQVSYSVNGGAYALVPTANYTYNAPNATLATLANGNSNPRAGQRAWSGADAGGVSRGSWGKTVVNMTGLANAGNTVQLRFDFGNDSCGGSNTGWYIDNTRLTACITTAGPTAAASSITGRILTGDSRAIANATITISDLSGNSRTVKTNSFGNFKITDLSSGQTYSISIKHKSYTFTPQLLQLNEDLADYVIRANP